MSLIVAYWPLVVSVLMLAALVLWWRASRRVRRVSVVQAGSPRQTWFPMGTRDRDLDDEADHADRSGGDDSAGD